jgi:hypothetical protein
MVEKIFLNVGFWGGSKTSPPGSPMFASDFDPNDEGGIIFP